MGSYRYPTLRTLDLRVEKSFRFGGSRVSAWGDFGNVFNVSTVTARQTRYPNRTITTPSGSWVVLYDSPTAVTVPRQIMFGARWSF